MEESNLKSMLSRAMTLKEELLRTPLELKFDSHANSVLTRNKKYHLQPAMLLKIAQTQRKKSAELLDIKNKQNNFYEKLAKTLEKKLKKTKNHSSQQAKQQIKLLQKCKNHKHIKRSNKPNYELSIHRLASFKSPTQRKTYSVNTSRMLSKVDLLMTQCQKQNNDSCGIRNNITTFRFYCKVFDKNLEATGKTLLKNCFNQ